MNSHQAQIVKNFCKHREKIGEKFSGDEPSKTKERWRILAEVDSSYCLESWDTITLLFFLQCHDDDPDLQLLLSMTDLLATCAEGDNIFIESVCETLLPFQELTE